MCCDLLSFYYLCRTGNNINWNVEPLNIVVICFHFTIFVVLETTYNWMKRTEFSLWFAFILLSLSYWKQPFAKLPVAALRCDLLSFYYLCRTGNNDNMRIHLKVSVVICFHFTIFVVLETTVFEPSVTSFVLWFAFILLSLSYWKQQLGNVHSLRIVVICFHFTIFVVLETTMQKTLFHINALWFAFILLSLSYWKQLNLYYSLYVSAL